MKKKWIVFELMLVFCIWSYGQDSSYTPHVRDSLEIDVDIFAIEIPAEITLKYNIKEYQKNKYKDKYQTAELIYHLGDSMADRHQTVRIKARGNNRKATCTFPPLWINIKKADIHNIQLRRQKRSNWLLIVVVQNHMKNMC